MNFLRQCVLWCIGFPVLMLFALALLVFSTIPDNESDPK